MGQGMTLCSCVCSYRRKFVHILILKALSYIIYTFFLVEKHFKAEFLLSLESVRSKKNPSYAESLSLSSPLLEEKIDASTAFFKIMAVNIAFIS